MKRTLVNLLIDLSAALLFLAMLATGFVLRFPLPPGTNKTLSLWGLTRHQWGGIHFWVSGALLAVLLVHLALHWQWIVTVVGKQLGLVTSPQQSNLRSGILATLAVAVAFAAFAWASYRCVRGLEVPCCTGPEPGAVPKVAQEVRPGDNSAGVEQKVDFWKDVYPIFEASCLSCHGPRRASGGFRIDRREDYFEIRRAGADVLVVTQSRPEAVSAASLPLPTVCDSDRVAYRYFGLDRGHWSMFLRWNVLAHYLRLIFTGWRPHHGEAGEDVLQLGGDFIISADRRLLYAHRSNDPADRPPVADLVNQIQALTRSPPGEA